MPRGLGRSSICVGITALLLASSVSAQLTASKAGWQLSQSQDKKAGFRDIESWSLVPKPGLSGRPRAMVTLTNNGERPAGAIVLRYAFSARLVRRAAPEEPGVWSVPFILEDRRIPQVIGPQKSKDVPIFINRVALDQYLKRIYHNGFWIDAVKIQVLVEPRPGETLENRLLEAILPVAWKQS